MSSKSIFFLIAALLLTTACLKQPENTYTYAVEGEIRNIVNLPVEGIRVIRTEHIPLKTKQIQPIRMPRGNTTYP